jgi:DNA-binding NtrC family response regulator
MIGRDEKMLIVFEWIRTAAKSDISVLILGPTGSGKEVVARMIHELSRRSVANFQAVNCAALPDTLFESEIFGYEKGAFTGAHDRKPGRLELANDGTLFLDEIADMSLIAQAKLLRVLEERRFERVGGQKAIEVDVRVVAATNRDLAEMVKRGQFREDLFYRLSVIQIEVPPLRARLDDVPLLADHFLARFRQQAARRITGFSPEALAAMTRYHWPGNVRELRNAVERAIVLGDREQIVPADLPPQVVDPARRSDSGVLRFGEAQPPRVRTSSPTPPLGSAISSASLPPVTIDAPPPPPAPKPPPARSLRELEKEGILAALAATGGNKAQAAAILEIDRSTLYKKLKDYGIGE